MKKINLFTRVYLKNIKIDYYDYDGENNYLKDLIYINQNPNLKYSKILKKLFNTVFEDNHYSLTKQD